jgi:L-iditol 2-dehydrogenase
VDFAQASIIEPFSCVLNGQEIVQVKLNDRVAVIGAGPIGIMHAMLAKAFGASKVMITDINQARLDQCAQIDADFIPLRSDDLREEIMRHTDGKGLDVCIVACPSPRAQEESLGLMATNGRILYFGGLPVDKDKITISSNTIHYKQLRVCGATRANVFQYRKIASMIENKRMDLKPLISAAYPIDEFRQAVEYAKSGIGIKTVIVF